MRRLHNAVLAPDALHVALWHFGHSSFQHLNCMYSRDLSVAADEGFMMIKVLSADLNEWPRSEGGSRVQCCFVSD